MDFWAYLRGRKVVDANPEGGGSTLTQQVAKNPCLRKTRNWT